MVSRELRSAAVRLLRQPRFTLPAIGSLAVGVGVTVAVTAIVTALWIRPSVVPFPERTFGVAVPIGADTDELELNSFVRLGLARRLQAAASLETTVLEYAAGESPLQREFRPTVILRSSGRVVEASAVSSNFFRELGVEVLGPGLATSDDAPGGRLAVVISANLADSVGIQTSGGLPTTLATTKGVLEVVGVVSDGFRGVRLDVRTDLWLSIGSLAFYADQTPAATDFAPVSVLARLRPTVGLATAQTELRTLVHPAADFVPLRLALLPLTSTMSVRRQDRLLGLIAVGAAAVLVVGCANLSMLWLTRLHREQGQRAVRVALGSPKRLIVLGIAFEVGLTTLGALLLGIGVSGILLRLLASQTLPAGLSVGEIGASVDSRVLLIATGAVALTMCLTALLPLYRGLSADLGGLTGRTSAAPPSLRAHQVIVGTHSAATVALAAIAVQLSMTVVSAWWSDRGFSAADLHVLEAKPRLSRYASADGQLMSAALAHDSTELLRRVRALNGVAAAEFGRPILHWARPPSLEVKTEESTIRVPITLASGGPGIQEVLGLTLAAGRSLDVADRAASPRPVLVDRRLAQRLWPGQTALGRDLDVGQRRFQVVGLVEPVRTAARTDQDSYLVLSLAGEGEGPGGQTILIRGTRHDAGFRRELLAAAESVLGDPAAASVRTTRELIDDALAGERLGAVVFSAFGLAATVLALCGLAGLAMLTVETNRRALGIRLALGASTGSLAAVVGRYVLVPVGAGLVVGLITTIVASGPLRYSIPEYQNVSRVAMTLASVTYLMAATAVLALPVRNMLKIDPTEVLRET